MEYFSKTDIGRKREVNQDYVFATDQPIGNIPNLLIVADGMGGHKAGDFASKYTTESVVESLKQSTVSGPQAMFEEAISKANTEIIELAASDVNLEGMGTTLVVATVIEHTLYFANVGDSRLYVIGDEIKQLSKDHSLVEEMVRLGGINEDEAKHHPDKNIITRAIGAKLDVEIDFFEYRIVEGDIILMCTDGLSNMVEDEDVFRIIRGSRDLPEAVQGLIDQANLNGGKDNIGIVLAKPLSDEERSL
ncbi:MAG: Stp1/IreP family PP2C-type Ser/Thr phosphatase [Lachnospiraceae bacterium]|nr:Stp1/IreP family PP2C-type Ser/Thr phosphatase [Mogibacterium sp.]MBQ6311715.1 Stp1/IreP family PP2C-type Ser/Thr phosphatase [Lachnospiraceae bacterium]MBQ6354120.1 Stp1/IreP family PP2C-type Ser/Thr phosphatase [Lachnospiraceae bacterium]MBR2752558.1 Stp1/IreP family PP2C-type Ser/Thr phosphatase [Lachnospiraceae bacterium]